MNEKTSVKNLGKNIKYIRENICHMTQEKFSESTNISVTKLKRFEQGISLPNISTLFAIADFADVPVDFLNKDDIDISKLYTIIFLMKEIEKYDKPFIENASEMLSDVYGKSKNTQL